MVRVEVRCCCDAGKLLGTVPVPDGRQVQAGRWFEFALPGERLRLQVAVWEHWLDFGDHRGGLALRSDDTPLERLRQIPGWEDV